MMCQYWDNHLTEQCTDYFMDMTKTRTGPEKRTEFGIAPRLQSVSAYVISFPEVHGESILSDLVPIQIGQGEASDAINVQWCIISDVACKDATAQLDVLGAARRRES